MNDAWPVLLIGHTWQKCRIVLNWLVVRKSFLRNQTKGYKTLRMAQTNTNNVCVLPSIGLRQRNAMNGSTERTELHVWPSWSLTNCRPTVSRGFALAQAISCYGNLRYKDIRYLRYKIFARTYYLGLVIVYVAGWAAVWQRLQAQTTANARSAWKRRPAFSAIRLSVASWLGRWPCSLGGVRGASWVPICFQIGWM